jgi:hypothetical protein
MPFTATEKERFIAALQRRGWQLRKGSVWSPGEGLYFNDAHFEHWTPAEMRAVFTGRANRIKEAALEGWQKSVDEYRQVCTAAGEALNGKS